ncbi:MAG: M48 family metalloprotease [Steroidobacteraceae bacterium]
MKDLVYERENSLFRISVVIGVVAWLVLLVATAGVVLLLALFFLISYLFVQSAFVSHLRGNSVELGPGQMPELYSQYTDCCRKLEVADPPKAYLMMSDGVLNAFAARFLRRYYVVVFSSVIEALKSRPEAVRFYFGHELSHVVRGHLKLRWLKLPASVLPLLGAAYRRAQEYTCDLHGMAASNSVQDSVAALAVLATGGEKLPSINIDRFVEQQRDAGGFWMSYHELTADYPWLCKRVSHLLRVSGNDAAALLPPRRSFWSGVLAFFTPRLGAGGGSASLIVMVAIMGMLAAIAIPAYRDYTLRAQAAQVFVIADEIAAKAAPYVNENGAYPDTASEVGLPEDLDSGPVSRITVGPDGFEMTLRGTDPALDGQTVVVGVHRTEDGGFRWHCQGGTLAAKYRPAHCRP